MSETQVTITRDDPRRPDVIASVEAHLADMRAASPPESVHALDLDALSAAEISFYSARSTAGILLGTVALKDLGDGTGELKSMRTLPASRGRGVGRLLLEHAIGTARDRAWSVLYLETGTQEFFRSAHRLYSRAGFVECGPFADYALDPASVFFRLAL